MLRHASRPDRSSSMPRRQVPSLPAHPRPYPGSAPPLQIMRVARGPEFVGSLAHRHVIVIGLARSGVAATRLLRAAGAEVLAVDAKPAAMLGEIPTELES